MPYVKGAKGSRPKTAETTRTTEAPKPVDDLDDLDDVEPIVLSKEDKAAVDKTLAAIDALTPEVRTALIDEIMSRYCSMCSETLDEDGDCPEGCDPEDMLDDEDDEDDENGDGEADEDDDAEETEEP
jgi:hypothetical protein